MILDCLYRHLPPPLRFLYSFCFEKLQYTPYQSDSRHLKAASKKLCNRLTDLQKEHCPIIAVDFGVITTKLVVFVPQDVVFEILAKYQSYMLMFLNYSSSALGGEFLFFRFEYNEIELLVDFLNEQGFPFTAEKLLNCTGSAALATAPLLLERTGFTDYRKFNRHNCQREGLIFNHSLKLKQEFFHCARPDQGVEHPEILQKWRGQQHCRRISMKEALQLPCLFADIGNTLKIYRFSAESFEILGEYKVGGGTFFGIANLLLMRKGVSLSYSEITDLAHEGNPSNVDLTVGDIYGGDYSGVNLDRDLLAACFGKFVELKDSNVVKTTDNDAEHLSESADSDLEVDIRNVSDANDFGAQLQTLGANVLLQGQEENDGSNMPSFNLADALSALQRMVAINAAQLAARFVFLTGLKQCVFSGGFLDSQKVLENVSWAFHLYSGEEAVFIQHDVVLCALGALFGDEREYQLDDGDDVVRLVEMIENDRETSVDVAEHSDH